MKVRLKRLNESGFDHVMILVVFVALFALIGTWLLLMSNAATEKVTLHLASTTGPCVAGTTIQHCSGSPAQTWDKMTGSNFQIKNGLGQCLDDWNGKVHTSPKDPNGYIHVSTCYGNANQHWNWAGGELRNVASGGCLNAQGGSTSPGTALIVYACNGKANEIWKEVAASSSGSGGGGGSSSCAGTAAQRFICQAHKYQGAPYAWGGGHDYGSFKHICPRPSSSGSCATDCSGFVSVVVDDVTGGSYSWTAGSNVMVGGGSGHWHLISASKAVPGDIATASGHVEFVSAVSNGRITQTFGEHNSGDVANAKPAGYYAIGAVYHWE